jgi:L,D-peptidoglycan transpeptidase YkuD (ErfK/YbiS/YcfS/YnhG family)
MPNAASARVSLLQVEYDAIIEAINNDRLPPQNTALGGEIYIHGGGIDGNWTRGCIALTNEEMETLFDFRPRNTGRY